MGKCVAVLAGKHLYDLPPVGYMESCVEEILYYVSEHQTEGAQFHISPQPRV